MAARGEGRRRGPPRARVVRQTPAASEPRVVWPALQPQVEAFALALQFQLEQSQYWSPEALLERQLRQIHELVRHAQATVPFYRDSLAELAAVPPGRLGYEAFQSLPRIGRQDIQRSGQAMASTRVPKDHGSVGTTRTSGSTGRPIEVKATALMGIFLQAFTMRGHLWHQRDLSRKNVDIRTAFAPGQTPKRARWAPIVSTGPTVRLDISMPIGTLFDQLITEDPAYLQSHPNVIQGLLERSHALGVKPASLLEARTFGESLPAGLREAVHAAWGVPLVDSYSAMEIGSIAIQCPESEVLHVMAEGVLVEVLDDDGKPCAPGETGRVTLTPLHNFAMPLIRYEIGDYATVAPPCACGRGLPSLAGVVGRQRNLLVYPNGDWVFPETRRGGLVDVAPIHQFQLVQESVDRLVFRVAPGRPWTAAEEDALRRFLHAKFRHPFEIAIEYLDEIPRQANGKYDEFISHVAAAPTATD